MDPLNALQIALAVFGGYKGFQSSKKAHAGILGQILGTAGGAYGGYSLGTGISSLGETAVPSIFGKEGIIGPAGSPLGTLNQLGISAFNPSPVVDQYAGINQSIAPTNAVTSNQQLLPGATINQPGYPVPQYATPPSAPSLSYEQTPKYWDQALPAGATPSSQVPTSGSGITSVMPQQEQPTNVGSITTDQYGNSRYGGGVTTAASGTPVDSRSFLQKMYYEKLLNPETGKYEAGDLKLMPALATLGAGAAGVGYATGAFDPVPKTSYLYGSNLQVPSLEKNREFYVKDPKTGEIKALPHLYTPEEANIANPYPNTQNVGPYQVTKATGFNIGGLASLSHFKDGGVSYLPSKVNNDEDNEANYQRANGYVADASGVGNKDVDTMLAQLADGEFVTRTDGVLGAGILAGANPGDEKQMRKMGADFFYEQQKRFKRIFDLLDASRKATQH